MSRERVPSGVLVAVVGPSGAGKDTLIGEARGALEGRPPFIFVRRLVTRNANPFEDHDTIDEAAFTAAEATGAFSLSWRAHGLGYALPASVAADVAAGSIAICNLSRRALPEARRRFAKLRVVEVTAPMAVLAARQALRGREDIDAIRARLDREFTCEPVVADLTIINDRPLDVTGGLLVTFLRALAAETEPVRLGAHHV